MSHLQTNKKILNRIRRLRGQMNAVHNALTNADVSCIATLQQVAAIKGAINGLMNELVQEHLKTHVLKGEYNQQELEIFLETLKKYG
ncbi:metal/formaldehyde-sensitive transcriptional repressor [Acinetobacter sp. ANC 5380]|uniref:Metal/formaldehyde-sensitive transcriptional repressor n=1 Tax=Acinetobacter terrae TaxID=2731247 RepID=A0A7Y2WCG5_9GAMM|nr:metal/formaldehyde-sensitive transcriptional repressor [Acinetobacter terrae]NNH79401.1 metal/formaldehyde-sensitive transcriptional repressor [Acinetobacter terrae]